MIVSKNSPGGALGPLARIAAIWALRKLRIIHSARVAAGLPPAAGELRQAVDLQRGALHAGRRRSQGLSTCRSRRHAAADTALAL